MADQYRVRLADGQLVEMAASPASIRKQHPNARIEGRVVVDELGQGRIVPYQGEQPEAPSQGIYDDQKVAELLVMAKERDIEIASSAKKADVIAALQADDDHKAAEGQDKG